MNRFVRFHVQGMNIAIRPEHVTSITCDEGTPDVCHVFTAESDEPVTVHALFDDVVTALEAAGTPAPAPVVVEPSDLERTAKVLDRLANAARDGGWDYLDVDQIDDAIEVSSSDWSDTADALIILADRLRGLAR